MANFRDLNGAIIRMSTLAPGGRITKEVVQEEISRLKASWQITGKKTENIVLKNVIGAHNLEKLDRFETVQLADVIGVCRKSKNLSEAGRRVFAVSRKKKKKSNDADRLRKYLAKYHIKWEDLS